MHRTKLPAVWLAIISELTIRSSGTHRPFSRSSSSFRLHSSSFVIPGSKACGPSGKAAHSAQPRPRRTYGAVCGGGWRRIRRWACAASGAVRAWRDCPASLACTWRATSSAHHPQHDRSSCMVLVMLRPRATPPRCARAALAPAALSLQQG